MFSNGKSRIKVIFTQRWVKQLYQQLPVNFFISALNSVIEIYMYRPKWVIEGILNVEIASTWNKMWVSDEIWTQGFN